MRYKFFSFFVGIFLLSCGFVIFNPFVFAAEEQITLTTFYPSPNGVYDKLGVNKLAVDVNGVAVASEFAAMANGDAHIGRSLIVGAGGGSGFAYDEGALPTDGDVLIKGDVGIGTAAPGGKIDVRDSSARQLVLANSTSGSHSFLNAPGNAHLSGNAYWDQTNWNRFNVGNGSSLVDSVGDSTIRFYNAAAAANPIAWAERMRIDSAGNVGIGTNNPQAQLHVTDGAVGVHAMTVIIERPSSAGANTPRLGFVDTSLGAVAAAPVWCIDNSADTFRIFRQPNISTSGFSVVSISNTGNVGIGTAPTTSILKVGGSISGGETTTGWVFGRGSVAADNWLRLTTTQAGATYHDLAVGRFWANGALRFDLAEITPVKEEDELSQGEVVVIDKDKGARVIRSTKPYDTSVYGIVSSYEQAAMVIGGDVGPENAKKAKNRLPIALVGRVKAKVSAENGSIEAGDILTTSSTPGHLMKCADRNRCIGAVAGKALESLEKGAGEITVLVTLQ